MLNAKVGVVQYTSMFNSFGKNAVGLHLQSLHLMFRYELVLRSLELLAKLNL